MTAGRVSTAGLDAGERRLAARALLASPILTAARQPAELDLVRRHAGRTGARTHPPGLGGARFLV